jgi:hypothetical protein
VVEQDIIETTTVLTEIEMSESEHGINSDSWGEVITNYETSGTDIDQCELLPIKANLAANYENGERHSRVFDS